MSVWNDDEIVTQVYPNKVFNFDEEVTSIRFNIEWINLPGIICDLDLVVYQYDSRVSLIHVITCNITDNFIFFFYQARFIEKLDFTQIFSSDYSTSLIVDGSDSKQATSNHSESVHVNLTQVDHDTSCMLICLDGDARIFQFVHTVNVRCVKASNGLVNDSFVRSERDEKSRNIFYSTLKTKKDCKGLMLCTLYKVFYHF